MVYHLTVTEVRAITPPYEPEADRVARQLRDEIIDGVRRPGTRLVERDLAEEMGVSRVPVREALRVLAAEGLVIPRPRTWALVRTFTSADVDELVEVRSALELLSFRLAAQRATEGELSVLRQHLQAERDAVRDGDVARARRAGADFHEAVVATAGNGVLTELFARLRSRMRWLLGQHSGQGELLDEHQALLDALAAHDVERAASLAEAHLTSSRSAVREYRSIQPGPSRTE